MDKNGTALMTAETVDMVKETSSYENDKGRSNCTKG